MSREAAPSATAQARAATRLASVVIVTVLLSQGVATFRGIERLGWPFVSYPMYSWPHRWGETINRYALFGILQDGTEVPVTADDLNMNFWEHLWGPVDAVRKNKLDTLRYYLAHDRHLNNRVVVSVRLENRPLLFTPHGAEELPLKTVKVIHMDHPTLR